MWSVLYTIKNVLFDGLYSWKDIFISFVTGQSAAPFYYILVMLQLMLMTPLLVKIQNNRCLYAVTPIYLCGLYVWNFSLKSTPPLYGTFFPAWLIFYLLGLDAQKGKLDTVATKVNALWGTGALLITLMESFTLQKAGCCSAFACSQIKFSSFIYAFIIILCLLKGRKIETSPCFLRKILERIGDDSYGIFYSHMMIMYVVSKVLRIMGVDSVWGAFWLLDFIFTVLISFLFVESVKKLMPSRKMQKVLGLI